MKLAPDVAARPRQGGQVGAKGETGKMSETQALLSRIVSLRQRLEQAQGLARSRIRQHAGPASPHAGECGHPLPAGPARVAVLEEALAEGAGYAPPLDYAIPPLT